MRRSAVREVRSQDVIGGVGLSVSAIQSVARRQLVGSIVVAILVAAVAGLTALRPAPKDTAVSPEHKFAIVRQPTFVATPDGQVAAMRHATELP